MKRVIQRFIFIVLLLTITLTSCGSSTTGATPSPVAATEPATVLPEVRSTAIEIPRPIVEEISFQSGNFELVGDLRMPAGEELFPAIIMVHGDGPATRNGAVPYSPTIEIFLRNGYAVFSWDKPGSGESTGEIDEENELTQRAAILADGIEALVEHPVIDPLHIGLWGLSQAGWVMPLALELTEDIAFMIVVSGGAEDSFEQMAYLMGKQVIADGASVERGALVEQYGPQAYKATNYAEYREAMEILIEIPELHAYYTLEIAEEDEWEPMPRDLDAFFDPMDVIEHTTIPILAIFGELDIYIDPIKGAEAYHAALQKARNQNYRIEVFLGRGHVFTSAPIYLELLEEWLTSSQRPW
ncbi:MAG: alpha/beta fold hydrolase [Anaerolineales bacterium]|nr:alpha/beta fold hydrolase [Anaerolineales bacterium]